MSQSTRIAVIAHALRSAGGLSVGKALIGGIVRNAPQHRYLFVVPSGLGYEDICAQAPQSDIYSVPQQNFLRRIIQDRFATPKAIGTFTPDAILALDSSLGLVNPPCPQAIFLHAPQLLYPESHYGPRTLGDKIRHAYLKRHFRKEIANTQTIFCQTDVMESRLRNELSFANNTIVCGTAVPDALLDKPAVSSVPTALSAHSAKLRLLYPTRYYPHKNVEMLIELFREYREELADVAVFLTISPNQHPNVKKLLHAIDAADLNRNLVNLGHIAHEQIGEIYRAADGMLMPSLLESFSTTYVEAMATGLPILTSDLDFAHAACGDAAMYFDPFNIQSVRDAIKQFRDNPQVRSGLINAGANRSTSDVQSWDTIANLVVTEIDRLAVSR